MSEREFDLTPPRLIKESDVDQVVELVKKGMPGYPFEYVYNRSAVLQDVDSTSVSRIVVADTHGIIYGTAVLGDNPKHMLEIKRVVTLPEARGNGIASLMTEALTKKALESGNTPWIDARGDQPGMQKASINSGYVALSLEKGKHCVYKHLNREQTTEVGPARETMVHFTIIKPDYTELRRILKKWPVPLVERLESNMTKSFEPKEKDRDVVRQIIPSASIVKQRVEDRLKLAAKNSQFKIDFNIDPVTGDIASISAKDISMNIVKPDASGFIDASPDDKRLQDLLSTGLGLGLQTMTIYADMDNVKSIDNLLASGLEPTMVLLWKESRNSSSTWKVGWRLVGNSFEDCLHYLTLHKKVRPQIEKVINSIR